jgi:hypothetical protein
MVAPKVLYVGLLPASDLSAAMEIVSKEVEFETFQKTCGDLSPSGSVVLGMPPVACISCWSGVEFNNLIYGPMTWRRFYVKPL